METVTLQEGLQEGQDESCQNRSEADISTDPLAHTDSSTSSVIVLEDDSQAEMLDSDDDEEPMSELSIMQRLCGGPWESSDIEGSPEQVYPEPPSPEYVPPSSSSYASSPLKTEVIDLAGSEDEEAVEAMEQGGEGE